ncbi:MAG: helix-turn-helix domain-containing protein [Rhodocyclaceae bacterium]|nr:helix-turn-helix domain-containing protein [Rhodocyclaceae bacterium]MDZ4214648.1 helix-turn-helix domain-containing protein [Rhodocyclaceae bacterium]
MNSAALSSPSLALNPGTLQLGGPLGWVDVSDPECTLLKAFAHSSNQRITTDVMLDLVGKAANDLGKRALEVQIVRLRKKLQLAGAPAPTIKSIRGTGYQLCIPVQIAHSSF